MHTRHKCRGKNAHYRASPGNLAAIVSSSIEAALILNFLSQLQLPALISMNTTHQFK